MGHQCPNTVEDLEHKFTACALWNHLHPRLDATIGRKISFNELQLPELKNVARNKKYQALKQVIVHAKFVLDAINDLSVYALDFVLNSSFCLVQ